MPSASTNVNTQVILKVDIVNILSFLCDDPHTSECLGILSSIVSS